MKKEFCPYEIALDMKSIGFDEPCLAKYQKLSEAANYQLQLLQKERNCNRLDTAISAPTFSQAFRWLYQKLSIENGTMPLDTESQQLLLKELIDKISSKHLLV